MRVHRRLSRDTSVSLGPVGCLVYAIFCVCVVIAVAYWPFWLIATVWRAIFG